MNDGSNRLEGGFGRSSNLHVKAAARIVAFKNRKIRLFRILAKTTVTEVRHHADDFDIAHFRRAFVNSGKPVERNAELVLMRASRDVLVGARIDIGIGPQRNRRPRSFCACDAINVLQLPLALDIEAVNTLLKRVFYFLTRFTHACERAVGGIAARGEHAIKFATRNNVEARARFGEQL